MASKAMDIVARLQLRADQFSSEAGKSFAEMKTRARSAAQDVRASFASSFAEVNKLAQTSLVLPRTDGGSLDLSAEIAQLKLGETAAEQKAIALRELSVAQTAAAGSANVDAEAMRREADAAAVASLHEEQAATAIRQRIVALEAVQTELNRTTSATRQLTAAEERELAVNARHRQSVVMLGQQFQDFTVQMESGQGFAIAFAQNIGQAAYAMDGMGGTAGKVGRFLTGGLGSALTLVAIVAVPAIAKMLEFSDEAERAGENAKHAAEGADAWSEAASDLEKIIDLTTGKLKSHNVVLAESIRLEAIFKRQQGQEEAEAAEKAIRSTADAVHSQAFGGTIVQPGVGPGGGAVVASNPQFRTVADKFLAGGFGTQEDPSGIRGARIELEKLAGASQKLDGKPIYDFVQQLDDLAKARDKISAQDATIDAIDGKGVDGRLKRDTAGGRTRKPADHSSMINSAEEEIARINAQWDAQPRLIDKANLEILKLNNLIEDLRKQHPAGFEQLIAAAEDAKLNIQSGLVRTIGEAFDKPQTLADKGREALEQLASVAANADAQIAALSERKPPDYEKTIAQLKGIKDQAAAAGDTVREGMSRPFEEFVRQQRESLTIGQMTLEGRDAEAEAMQAALRIQQAQGAISEGQLATVLRIAQANERISRALEDQRRIVNIYVSGVGDLQRNFETFLASVQDGKIGSGVTTLVNGWLDGFKTIERNLLSNAIFGGIDRKVEEYVRKMTGKKTPAEILGEQAGDAGRTLNGKVDEVGDALDALIKAVRAAGDSLASPIGGLTGTKKSESAAGSVAEFGASISQYLRAHPANDNASADQEIVVYGIVNKLGRAAEDQLKSMDVFGVIVDGIIDNLSKELGIKLPANLSATLKKDLAVALEGASFGQLGGSVLSALTGTKQDSTASAVGGILGDVLGRSAGSAISSAIGGSVGKALGSAAGPIGALVGGMLGPLVTGLFSSHDWSDATITLNQYGSAEGTQATGKSGEAIAAATGTASSVAAGINAVAEQLGATIESLPAITLGTWDDKYRVALTSTTKALNYGNFTDAVLKDFGSDQQAAIEYAVRYSISNAVLSGISQASQNILKSGQDLETAIEKALLIEAVPRDLKAMLDPVGSAIDELNLKWQKTVNALEEGGATAEQMAQAEELYNLQLEEVKNTTRSAAASLKDFLSAIDAGSSSPYSLRDQEASALAQLQPFLDQIDTGERINQDAYQQAAQTFLDIERQLYGSGSAYFDALAMIQSATNSAIAEIENVDPIGESVESPFAETTAENTGVINDQLDTTNELLLRIAEAIEQASAGELAGETRSAFFDSLRDFVRQQAA